ncbi:geranylgeranyl reductase family protein [Polaribacter sp.]|nr:geranylgeranyl reductase family protein [Polaribacter sp.]
MNHYNVAIIGSGPSGAATALFLGKKGISTVIIEKEILPRYKTCGGGFVNRGKKLLPIDIEAVTERSFFSVDTYFNNNYHYQSKKSEAIITMIMRDTFDNLIVEKAAATGVTLLQENTLKNIEQFPDKTVLTTDKLSLSADFIIAADGVLSPTAKLSGWKTDTRKLIPALEYEVEVTEEKFKELSKNVRFDIDAVPHGYAWCFPKKNHLSLGVLTTKKGKINLKEYYKKYLETLGINEIVDEKAFGFQIPVAPRTDGFVKENVFLVGDAAGFADPITAEGISNSLLSGRYAAEAIIESNLDREKATDLYLEKLNIKLLYELKSGATLAKYFYNNNPVRNYILKKHGQKFSDLMVDVLHGEREFPKNIQKKLQKKIKEAIF